jgi:DNA repair photolyase
MPGINDSPEQVERIVEIATEAGAVGIGGITLHLRGEVRVIFFDWLREHRPDLIPYYERLYARGAYAPRVVQERMRKLAAAPGLKPRRFLRDREDETGHAAARDPVAAPRNGAAAEPLPDPMIQDSLF